MGCRQQCPLHSAGWRCTVEEKALCCLGSLRRSQGGPRSWRSGVLESLCHLLLDPRQTLFALRIKNSAFYQISSKILNVSDSSMPSAKLKLPHLLLLTSSTFPRWSSPLLSEHAQSLCLSSSLSSALPVIASPSYYHQWIRVHLGRRLNCYINGFSGFQHLPNLHEPLLDSSLALWGLSVGLLSLLFTQAVLLILHSVHF